MKNEQLSTVFDRNLLESRPLHARKSDLNLSNILKINDVSSIDNIFRIVASKIIDASIENSAVVLMMGAHVLRSGVQKYIIDLMERVYLSCIAINGAGIIHDFEFAHELLLQKVLHLIACAVLNILNLASAVMGPGNFFKALSMVWNATRQKTKDFSFYNAGM